MPDVELARREGVELVNSGSWQLLSGSWNPNSKDIADAVEASKCPAVRRPRLKLGHLDERFNPADNAVLDGTPALGWFDNLRASADGNTLVGDQVALPWLSAVQPAAWPDRSIEGKYQSQCALGHTHPFVVTAVSLLGETPPGIPTLKSIKTLDDLPAALGVAASGEASEGGESVQAIIRASVEVHTGTMVALIPTAEDAARLAVGGGEPADELHCTLAYLGDAAALGAGGRQDVLDGVTRAANGLPEIEADAFSLNVFNPGTASDRDTCIVLGLSGDPIDAVHDLVSEALREALWDRLLELPPPHRPWHAHMTLEYTEDLARLTALTDRIGPVRFDRIRIAFGGERIDIPLIPPSEDETVAASAAIRDRIAPIRERLARLETVAAAASPTSDLPAAEPEQEINPEPIEEDFVSTELSGLRSRLGLPDDADLAAIEAKVDAIKADAEKTPEPTPEMVAASAAAVEQATKAEAEKDELRKEVQVLASQMQQVTTELSAAKAAQAATVKASVFDAAIKDGKLKPADREQWEKDYDEAPGAITRVLASIAVGTAVPVMASGTVGDPEPQGSDDDWDAIVSRLDSPKAV